MVAVYKKENELLQYRLEAAETELTFHTVIEDMFEGKKLYHHKEEKIVKELQEQLNELQENLPVVT